MISREVLGSYKLQSKLKQSVPPFWTKIQAFSLFVIYERSWFEEKKTEKIDK